MTIMMIFLSNILANTYFKSLKMFMGVNFFLSFALAI